MHKTQFLKLTILHSELWPLSLSQFWPVGVCVLESYGIMSSFMIPAMKQPEFQIVSKKAKISRGTNWSTDGNTAKVTISHSEFWPVYIYIYISLSGLCLSFSAWILRHLHATCNVRG
jgi:hypothetical protein